MHRRTVLVLIFAVVIVCGAIAVRWRTRPVSLEEAFQTTLDEIARGDIHRVNAVRKQLLQDPRYAAHSRLLGAMTSFVSGQPQVALQQVQPIPDDPGLRWRFQLVAAQALHASSRFAEAESLLRQVVAAQPKEPDALRWLGMVYYDLGAMDHAVGPLTELAELQPEDYRPHWLLGVMYHDFERYPQAIEHLRAALQRSPPESLESEIRGELAKALVANRAYQETLDLLLPDPKTATQMQMVAKSYFNLGEMVSARSWADKAAVLEPTDPDLVLLQAELLKEQGNNAAAVRLLQQATDRHPNHPALRYQYSLALRADRRTTEADAQLQLWNEANTRRKRLVELNEQAIAKPYDRGIREELAQLCRDLKEPALAEMWQRAAESLPLRSPSVD